MIPKTTIIDFFSRSKVIFPTLAMVVTFGITLYNQFKTTDATEISGVVSAGNNLAMPVDAIVRISSPIQAQTETDSKGRFKFKFQNLQSDTFLLIVQNKTTNIINKQTEYVNASQGRTDIIVLSAPEKKLVTTDTTANTKKQTVHSYKKRTGLKNKLHRLFH